MSQTRITAGEWRGRVITTPPGQDVRPTRSLVRQSLFDILGARVVDAAVIDLCAGAGTVGFEALSRGAAHVTFVEQRREILALVARTAERFDCRERCELVCADVRRWLRVATEVTAASDLCYLDAPYRDPGLEAMLELLGRSPPRLVVCEHHHARRIAARIGELDLTREARHGLTTISFLQRTSTAADQHGE